GLGERIGAESGGTQHYYVVGDGRSGVAKSGRQSSDDGVRIVVQPNTAAEYAAIGSVGAAPQAIANYRRGSEAQREVLGTKQSSHLGSRAQHGEVVRSNREQ